MGLTGDLIKRPVDASFIRPLINTLISVDNRNLDKMPVVLSVLVSIDHVFAGNIVIHVLLFGFCLVLIFELVRT